MVIIRFPNTDMRRRGLAYLLGRSSGKSWVTGEVMVPEGILPTMAAEGITFSAEGLATYDRVLALNKAAAAGGSPGDSAESA